MNDVPIYQLIRMPSFWFGVVAAGIVVSTIGAFLKDALVKSYGSSKKWLSTSSQQRKRDRADYREFLINNPDALALDLRVCLMGIVQTTVTPLVLLIVALLLLFDVKAALPAAEDLPRSLIAFTTWFALILSCVVALMSLGYYRWYLLLIDVYRIVQKQRNQRWQP